MNNIDNLPQQEPSLPIQNQTPVESQPDSTVSNIKQRVSFPLILGAVMIVAVIAGGAYYLETKQNKSSMQPAVKQQIPPTGFQPLPTSTTSALPPLSNSSELSEKDITIKKLEDNNLELYQNCDGNPFESSCENGKCIKGGIERRIFDLWKQQFKILHNLNEEYFDKHIIINDVSYSENIYGETVTHWWRVDYIYKNDWVRSRQNESINLSDANEFTNVAELKDETIIKLLNISIEKAEKFGAMVIPYSECERLMKESKVDFDYCHIDFVNVAGNLQIRGKSNIDLNSNKCKYASIDLNSGTLTTYDGPCIIN